jgi:uncharacterized repeat protein (TIGR02543 family)
MKRIWKKTWSLILALSLVMSLLAVGAAAEELSVAEIGGNKYTTLAAAVEAATSGDVITLLSSCSGAGIGTFVNTNDGQLTGVKDFTIDFGGFTYNVTGPAVGSAGYLSQGFHLEKGANVTLKNGTITSTSGSGVKMLVQNYCNLTLQDITLDGTNLDGGTPYYTLSNNCGAVNINGNTTITAKTADEIAFDACWAPNKGYAEGTQVTLDTTGSIVGNIEFDLWGTDVDTGCLTTVDIKNCNMTGSFLTSTLPEAAKTNITISGGTFSSTDALKYLVSGANVGVKLAADETTDVTIPTGTTVDIDLNGKKLTSASSDTITNNGTLTVTDSGTGGTVDSIINSRATVFNNGTVTLNGGAYTRSAETGSSPTTGGTNTYYTILNHGTMTINSGASVTQNGHFSSLLDNGYYNYTSSDPRAGYVSGTNAANPALTVNGGTFSGGINTIKNDDGASAVINGGTFTNATQHALFNANVATVHGGTFESTTNYAVYNKEFGGDQDQGQMTITGGYFKGSTGDIRMDSGTLSVSGGYYTSDPSAYVDAGYKAASGSWTLDGNTYSYKVAAVPTGGGGTSSYTLTFNTDGGSAIASVSKTSGTTVDLTTYEPTRDGYDFAGWYSDNTLTTKVTSIKLTDNTTVYAKWISANPFTDVESGAYYHDAVLWAVGKGVTNGTTATTFSPDDTCTRAQAVTFLWRAMGSPEPTSSTCPFTDVDSSDYYYKAVLWAVEKGVTTGTTDTTFSPDDTVTRGQAVTFLYRAAETPAAGTTNPFTDVKSGDYYYDAVLWAVGKNITEGASATTFIPANDCTRAQIVTFLWRYLGK